MKEGDGDRVLNVYKIALLFYKRYGHTKYAYTTLLHLVKLETVLTSFKAHSLKYNRFFNKYGGKGKNISLDLRMEQFNKIAKCMWRALGANLDEKNAARVADAIEGMEKILESIDEDCALTARKGYRSNHEVGRAIHPTEKLYDYKDSLSPDVVLLGNDLPTGFSDEVIQQILKACDVLRSRPLRGETGPLCVIFNQATEKYKARLTFAKLSFYKKLKLCY